MPGTSGRYSQLEALCQDREQWLAALARAVQRGEYRPDCERIAEALLRAASAGGHPCKPSGR